MNGYAALALTKLDILDDLDEIKIGVDYVKNGKKLEHFPSCEQEFDGVSVEYVTMPGWKSSIAQCKTFESLPPNARTYVEKIEDYLGIRGN